MPASSRPASDSTDQAETSVDLGLLTRIKPLPVLPMGASTLIDVLSDATLPFDKLADSLENFPTIVARLLSLANSPWSSPILPVTSLDSVVARLGLDIVRSVSIALTIAAPFNPIRCAAFDTRRYWCSALLAAHTASRIAFITHSTIALPSPVARTAGLMHNLGLLWLADAMPQETGKALSIAANNPMTSVNAELMSICGVNYSHAGKALSAAWHIPQPIAAGMAYRLPVAAGSSEERMARLITLVTTMAAANLNESKPGVNPLLHEILGIDGGTYARAYDDLAITYPVIRELADTLFHSKF